MAEIVIQFSRAAPIEWFDKWVFDRSKLICRLSHSPFSHGDIVLVDGTLLGSSDSPKVPVLRGNPAGVAIRTASYHKFGVSRVARIQCTVEQRNRFYDYCMGQIGKPYDHAALKVGTFLSAEFENRDWRDEVAWFCFELIARGIEVSGVLSWRLLAIKNRITGADLLMMINPVMSNVDSFWGVRLRARRTKPKSAHTSWLTVLSPW
jgi:hypothetical protein